MWNRWTFSDTAEPVVAGALLMALVWTIAELAPIALRRWFEL